MNRKLDFSKGAWVNELPKVWRLFKLRADLPMEKLPFSMSYRAEAMSLVEVVLPSSSRLQFNKITNNELRRYEIDFIEKRIDDS